MALSKEKKKTIVDEVDSALKSAVTTVFASFKGITVAEVSDLRRTLRDKGVEYHVVKKSLLSRALDGLKTTGAVPVLDGQIAVAYGNDPIAPARELFAVGKKLSGKLSFAGGIFEGRYVGRQEIEAIALIPTRETLLARFVNIINSPIQGLVFALDGVAMKKS